MGPVSFLQHTGADLLHYMMNTGITKPEMRSHASDEVLSLFSGMYRPGTHPLPVTGFRAEVADTQAGCLCLVVEERSNLPLLTVAVAESHDSAERLWPDLARYFDSVRSCADIVTAAGVDATRPASEPWYATLTMLAGPNQEIFLGDFCRHFAWGWLEHQNRRYLTPSDRVDCGSQLGAGEPPSPAGIRRWLGPSGS